MRLNKQEIEDMQAKLDNAYEMAVNAYENAIAKGVPTYLLAKPERIVLENHAAQFNKPRGQNIKPHHKVKS